MKRFIHPFYQCYCFPEFLAETFRDPFFKFGIARIVDLDQAFADAGGIGLEKIKLFFVQIVYPFEGLPLADRPG